MRRIPGTASCRNGRAMALGMPWRVRPLADGVARRRVRVFVNICSGIFGVLRGESARAPHRVNAFRTLRLEEPVILRVPRILSRSVLSSDVKRPPLLVVHGGAQNGVAVERPPSRPSCCIASRRVASRRANLAERTSSGVRDCSSNGDTCVRPWRVP